METEYRSDGLQCTLPFDRFRDAIRSAEPSLDMHCDHASDFSAHVRELSFGAVTVKATEYPTLRVWRTRPSLACADEVQILVPLRGRLVAEAGPGEGRHVFGARELVVHDLTQRLDVAFLAPEGPGQRRYQAASVVIPTTLLPLPAARVARLAWQRLPPGDPVAALLVGYVTQLVAGAADGPAGYRPGDGPRLGNVLVDLASAVFARVLGDEGALEPESQQHGLLVRIQAFIQSHLHERELSPRDIAAAHHVSLSYLHRLFQRDGTTVGAWIRQQRLQRARRDLADPALSATPIHHVAARWGFSHAAAFSRAFRAAYGVSPRDFRGRACLGAA
jgi:AraC-like DNA-binding protein